MHATPSYLRSLSVAAALLLATPLFAQAPAAAPTQSQAAPAQANPELNNPLQPEKQPDLAVDRDPIPSPDIVVPTTAANDANFNQRAYLDQRFTADRVALNRGLSHFDSRGTTALYDAVAPSADELAHHAKQRKQVLLIVTDGADNASRLTLVDAIRRVQ